MMLVTTASLSLALIQNLSGPRDDWGSETEALCQFYELIGAMFGNLIVHIPSNPTPRALALALNTQLDWLTLPEPHNRRFAEGLLSLQAIDERYFAFAPE